MSGAFNPFGNSTRITVECRECGWRRMPGRKCANDDCPTRNATGVGQVLLRSPGSPPPRPKHWPEAWGAYLRGSKALRVWSERLKRWVALGQGALAAGQIERPEVGSPESQADWHARQGRIRWAGHVFHRGTMRCLMCDMPRTVQVNAGRAGRPMDPVPNVPCVPSRPCPACGTRAFLISIPGWEDTDHVVCSSCGVVRNPMEESREKKP